LNLALRAGALVAAAAAILVFARAMVSDAEAAERWTFVLLGQSNFTRAPAPPPAYPAADRIFVYLHSGRWRRGDELVSAAETVVDGVAYDAAPGGAGMAIAQRLAEQFPDVEIGLVPCAVTDTRIGHRRRAWSRTTYYGSCLMRAREAGGVRGAFVWDGENDTMQSTWASAYFRELMQLVGDWRLDIGDLQLPVVVAQLHAEAIPKFPSWNVVREAQAALEAPNLAVVSTDGVRYPDKVHTDAAGYEVVGRRMAEEMAPLLDGARFRIAACVAAGCVLEQAVFSSERTCRAALKVHYTVAGETAPGWCLAEPDATALPVLTPQEPSSEVHGDAGA